MGMTMPSGAVNNRERSLMQNAAFAPLNADLRTIPARSPLGKTPDQVSGRTDLNRARSFYNEGAQAAAHNKEAEAAYWFKQSVATIDLDPWPTSATPTSAAKAFRPIR